MRFEDDDGKIRTHRNNHQRQEQGISSGKLGDKEYTGKRSVHHARHQTSHSHQRKVFLRDISVSDMEFIAYIRKYETGYTSQKQTRSKNTTATASTVRGTGSEYFKQDYQQQIDYQQMSVAVKQ